MQQSNAKQKKVKFEDENICQLGMCQNLITHGHPNKGQDIEYNPQTQNIMDIWITNTNTKVTSEGDNFGQQCILLKKLNEYKETYRS